MKNVKPRIDIHTGVSNPKKQNFRFIKKGGVNNEINNLVQ